MNPFSWLLISDLHLKFNLETWSQKVVLREMVRDIEKRKDGFRNVQFIVVSGDLAFSGRPEEYALVELFLDDLRALFELERNRIFFVPGNHDINRDLQTTCFVGARQLFDSPQAVERFLRTPDERDTLLRRLAGFLDLDSRYCEGHDRYFTDDGLAFVAPLEIDGVPICIAGLNSAWLCEGGDEDMRQILVGDCPIIDIVELVRNHSPRLVIGVLHHPPDWLRDFDQRALEERFLPECDLLHRGHLHEPNVRIVSHLSGRDCIVIAAGAAYAGRDFDNCYSLITIEPRTSTCETSTFTYDGRAGRFSAAEPITVPIQLRGDIPGTMAELAEAIARQAESAESISSYLASLLDGTSSDVPIRVDDTILFASPDLLSEDDDAELSRTTHGFLQVRNLLLSFSDAVRLNERVSATADPIVKYSDLLQRLAQSDEGFAAELQRRNEQAQVLCNRYSRTKDTQFSTSLLDDLAHDGDWQSLEMFARRYAGSSDDHVALHARRRLALALGQSEEPDNQSEGASLASELASGPDSVPDDYALAISICCKIGDDLRAKELLLASLERFPDGTADLFEIGYRLVTDTGDVELKQRLDAVKSKGGKA